jgi:hypothetical protein
LVSPVKSAWPARGSKNALGFGSVVIAAARSTSAEALVERDFDGFLADGFFFAATGAALRASVFDAAFFGAALDFPRTTDFTFFALR